MKKQFRVVFPALGILSFVGLLAIAGLHKAEMSLGDQNASPYAMVLGGSNHITDEEKDSTVVVRNTNMGNPITFKVSTSNSQVAHDFAYLSNGGYLLNETPFSGISSISIQSNANDGRYKIEFGDTYGSFFQEEIFRAPSDKGGYVLSTNLYSPGLYATYFKITALSSNIELRNITINYACEEKTDEESRLDAERAAGDLLADASYTWDKSLVVDEHDTANTAFPDSGYDLKVTAAAGVTGYIGGSITLKKNTDLTNKNLVIFMKQDKMFPDFRITLLNADHGWVDLTNRMEKHMGNNIWAPADGFNNSYRAITLTAAELSSNLLAGQDLSAVRIINIWFPFGENSSVERTVCIDRIVAGENMFGFANSLGKGSNYAWTDIPLTGDGSQIPAGKSIEFDLKANKDSLSYTTNLKAANGGTYVKEYSNIIEGSGLQNKGTGDASVITLTKVDNGYWHIRLGADGFSAAPTKLVFERWNEAIGLIKNLQIVD